MKNIKKLIILLLLVITFTGCNNKKEEPKKEDKKDYISIMEYGEYKNIQLDNIEKITVYRITIAGAEPTEYTEQDDIEEIYNNLKLYKVGEKTEYSCEDNGKDYVFKMKDGKEYTIFTECDWFIINKERFLIEK